MNIIQTSLLEDQVEPGDDFTVTGKFAVIVDKGKVILEIKINSKYYAVTEPTDQYYRALMITENSYVEFNTPEDNTTYRLRPVKDTKCVAGAITIGGTII